MFLKDEYVIVSVFLGVLWVFNIFIYKLDRVLVKFMFICLD